MSIEALHEPIVVKTPDGSRAPLQVVCHCQWMAYARDEEHAERLKSQHIQARAAIATNQGLPVGRRL